MMRDCLIADLLGLTGEGREIARYAEEILKPV